MFVKYILVFSESTPFIFVKCCSEGEFRKSLKLPEWYRTNLTVWLTWIPGFLYLTEIYVPLESPAEHKCVHLCLSNGRGMSYDENVYSWDKEVVWIWRWVCLKGAFPTYIRKIENIYSIDAFLTTTINIWKVCCLYKMAIKLRHVANVIVEFIWEYHWAKIKIF